MVEIIRTSREKERYQIGVFEEMIGRFQVRKI